MSVTVPTTTLPAANGQPLTPSSQPGLAEPTLGTAEQAAVVLALLNDKSLGSLSGRLSPANKARFAAALERLSAVGPGEQQAIAGAFAQRMASYRAGVHGGSAAAARLSGQLYQETALDDEDQDEGEAQDRPKTFWERVEALGAEAVAEFLESCPVPAIATTLSALPEAFAADVIAKMPSDECVRAVVKLAATASHNTVAVSAVEQMVSDAFFGEDATSAPVDTARADRIAGLLNRMTTARREAVLAALPDQLDEDMMSAVKERVLGFDDLADRLPRHVVPIIFREADEGQLLSALSYAGARNSKTAEYLFANISQRLADQLKERLPADVPEDDGEKAQASVVGFVLGLVEKGYAELIDQPSA